MGGTRQIRGRMNLTGPGSSMYHKLKMWLHRSERQSQSLLLSLSSSSTSSVARTYT